MEQQLLRQFVPTFMIARHDCSTVPAEFKAGSVTPQVEAENGTIYGQAFPAKSADGSPAVELHYYHLWRRDCGRHGHLLDTEHVAVLVQPSSFDQDSAQWKAIYWYAAAHENTVCDVSQIARASTLHAEDHGATVWVSPGKHASYLNSTLCQSGCGADHCVKMTKFVPANIINLGEPGFPMNGSLFISSPAWPLAYKMSTSNFPASAIARLNQLPDSHIAWFNPGRHPVQGIIATSSSTEQALATSGANTSAAIGIAGNSTGDALSDAGVATGGALSNASDETGSALQKSYRHTRHALGTSIRHVGEALHLTRRQNEDQSNPAD
ncbi:MAG TPA: hypothetical protein VGR47_07310 [Terracidiphilus sp.]|nr:hypothetical protein [Terracidiphilus sp.]